MQAVTKQELDNKLDLISHNWEFVDPPPNECFCGHCKNVFTNPMIIECCGRHFCATCIEKTCGDLYRCPDCQEKNVPAILSKKMWKKILELDVKCPFSNRGCLWTGELGARAAHLNILNGDCEYVNIECKYGCREKLEKNEVAEHLEKLCPKRLVACPHCKKVGEHEVISGTHKSECPALPVDCPNGCGVQIKQENLGQHSLECRLVVVKCEFSYAGCNIQLQRKDMSQHLQEDMQSHMCLQAQNFAQELEKKENQLACVIKACDDELKRMSEIHSQQLRAKEEMTAKLIKEMEMKFQEETIKHVSEVDRKLVNTVSTFELKYNELKINCGSIPVVEQSIVEFTRLLHKGRKMTEIWLGKYNGMEVAIKKPKQGISPSNILGEAHILRDFEHKNIVTLHNTVKNGQAVCMILEYVVSSNLHDYLKANSPLLLFQQIDICKQVATALGYLQRKFCIHRKIRAGNVLYDVENQRCKLKDFSFAIMLESAAEHTPFTDGMEIPTKWVAPEVLKTKSFCLKSDVWSYGMLVWEIATGEEPFKDLSNLQASRDIIAGTLMAKPDRCTDTFYRVMTCCWKQNPLSRPTAETLFSLLDHVYKTLHH